MLLISLSARQLARGNVMDTSCSPRICNRFLVERGDSNLQSDRSAPETLA